MSKPGAAGVRRDRRSLTCAGSGESRSSSDTDTLFGVSVVRECVTRPLSDDLGSSESLHSSTSTSTSSSPSDSRSTDEFWEPSAKGLLLLEPSRSAMIAAIEKSVALLAADRAAARAAAVAAAAAPTVAVPPSGPLSSGGIPLGVPVSSSILRFARIECDVIDQITNIEHIVRFCNHVRVKRSSEPQFTIPTPDVFADPVYRLPEVLQQGNHRNPIDTASNAGITVARIDPVQFNRICIQFEQ
uniref:Uncharacterized protein n=1 Tax=Anopheles farauti TaxID=69004 RepID=A0A182QZX4_9DIPT